MLAQRLPWEQIEEALAPKFKRKERTGQCVEGHDLWGPTQQLVGAGVSRAGRPKLPIRLLASLLYLKHSFNLSDGRWIRVFLNRKPLSVPTRNVAGSLAAKLEERYDHSLRCGHWG